MRLSPEQIYVVARGAGFPPDTATKMVAIALRESAGEATALGTISPGEMSYGLWQINMGSGLLQSRMRLFGLSRPEELFEPEKNAAAAYKIWNGDDNNLGRHWYINRYGPPYHYAEKYEANLGVALQARVAVEGESLPGAPLELPPLLPALIVIAGVGLLAGWR